MSQHLIATGLVALLSIASAVAQPSATAEPMDMDPAILSKLALERARTRQQVREAGTRNLAGRAGDVGIPAECGAVNIGNVLTGGKVGFQPREITVVITGDVINANNQCK